jgi:predicted RNA-binding Zn ribbon-like protein
MDQMKSEVTGVRWDHDAGQLTLDFINTLEWRNGKSPNERLNRVPDLIDWAVESGMIGEGEAKGLERAILKDPESAKNWFTRILRLRETIYRIFSAISNSGTPSEADFAEFNSILAQSMAQSRLEWESDHYHWAWKGDDSLELLLWSVVRSAADLLTSADLHKLGECADDRGCAYLFMDESRNHTRRWCSMESCGNRAKARRHYERKTATGSL